MAVPDQPAELRLVLRDFLDAPGNPGNGLTTLSTEQLESGAIAFVLEQALGGQPSLYYLDKASSAPLTPPTIVQAQGGGRWLTVAGASGGGIASIVNVGGGPGQVLQSIIASTASLRTLDGINDVVVATAGGLITIDGDLLLPRDGSRPLTGNLDAGSNRLTNLAAPVAPSDAARLQDVGGSTGPVTLNKRLTPAPTGPGDQSPTGITVSITPQPSGPATQRGYLRVLVNGVGYDYGAATNSAPCFLGPNAATARALDEVQAGDQLFWNGSLAGFQLDASDEVSLDYTA